MEHQVGKLRSCGCEMYTLAPAGRTAGSPQVSPWPSSVGRFTWESVVCVAVRHWRARVGLGGR